MGTRSTIAIYEGATHLVTIYQQYDGYPDGVGKSLAEFIQSGKFVNGLGVKKSLVFNGMGCFAAALIKHLKDGPGGTYIVPKGQKEEYNYKVVGDTFDERKLTVACQGHESFKAGSVAAFMKWCKEQK